MRLDELFNTKEYQDQEAAQTGIRAFFRRKSVRRFLLALWLVIFSQDVIYNTFLRPAGTLNFMRKEPTVLDEDANAYRYNQFLTIN